jgi:hypothetical protein
MFVPIPYSELDVPHPMGLQNSSNNCWSNAIIQLFLGLPSFNIAVNTYRHELMLEEPKNEFIMNYLKYAELYVDEDKITRKLNEFIKTRKPVSANDIGPEKVNGPQSLIDDFVNYVVTTDNTDNRSKHIPDLDDTIADIIKEDENLDKETLTTFLNSGALTATDQEAADHGFTKLLERMPYNIQSLFETSTYDDNKLWVTAKINGIKHLIYVHRSKWEKPDLVISDFNDHVNIEFSYHEICYEYSFTSRIINNVKLTYMVLRTLLTDNRKGLVTGGLWVIIQKFKGYITFNSTEYFITGITNVSTKDIDFSQKSYDGTMELTDQESIHCTIHPMMELEKYPVHSEGEVYVTVNKNDLYKVRIYNYLSNNDEHKESTNNYKLFPHYITDISKLGKAVHIDYNLIEHNEGDKIVKHTTYPSNILVLITGAIINDNKLANLGVNIQLDPTLIIEVAIKGRKYKYTYILASIVLYSSTSGKGGHYYCYSKRRDDNDKLQWYDLNDRCTEPLNESDVLAANPNRKIIAYHIAKVERVN